VTDITHREALLATLQIAKEKAPSEVLWYNDTKRFQFVITEEGHEIVRASLS